MTIQQTLANIVVPKKFRFGLCKLDNMWYIWDTKEEFNNPDTGFMFSDCDCVFMVDLWDRLRTTKTRAEIADIIDENTYADEDTLGYAEYCGIF